MSTQITIATSVQPQRLTKLWQLQDGNPEKIHAGEMVKGSAHRVTADTPVEFAQVLGQLKANQALIFGLPPHDDQQVVTRAALENAPAGTITRTKDFFRWNNGPGWLLLDGDPLPGQEPLTRDQWLALLYEAAPALREAPSVWGVSSSSLIFNSETDAQVTGVRGQRLYVLIADARDIPRAGKALFDRLWLAGHGRYIVSKSGQTLSRAPIDASVWQTNRLDFAAPPVCVAPLEARRPNPEPINIGAAPLVTTGAIPDLTQDERQQLIEIMDADRKCDDLLAEIGMAQEAWIDERLASVPASQQDEARDRLRDAVEKRRLFGDFELIHSTGNRVTVGELLDKPDQWHGERFHDPLEPDYSNSDHRIAWANLKSGGTPYIYSHAHGGVRYRLLRPVATLQMAQGEMPQILPKVLERMRIDGEIFERAGALVRLAGDAVVTVERPWLQTYLETAFSLQMFDGRNKKWEQKDCPDKLANRIMAARGDWDLPHIGGIVTFPVMRRDGSIITKPGYDAAAKLLYLDNAQDRPAPYPLDKLALQETLRRIWEPFSLFPFDGDLSRGVFMTALLTTVCRPTLDTAPAFLIRAFTPGTGKTLLSRCLMLLAGAPDRAMPLPEGNAEEIGKRLFSVLLQGRPGVVLDNLTGVVDSADLCVFLTSAEPEGRILGQTEIRSALNRALWILNGNNVSAGGDTFRRLLPITLDANVENPESRRFAFRPDAVIADRLESFRADLLSVLLTYQEAGAPVVGYGSLGGFEDWESLVRQCVCWLIREGVTPAGMADPAEVLALSKAEDPDHQRHAAILEAWCEVYGDHIVQVRDIGSLLDKSDTSSTAAELNLAEVIRDVATVRGQFNGRYLGGWLRQKRGRIVNGYRLDAGDPKRKEPGWRVTLQF